MAFFSAQRNIKRAISLYWWQILIGLLLLGVFILKVQNLFVLNLCILLYILFLLLGFFVMLGSRSLALEYKLQVLAYLFVFDFLISSIGIAIDVLKNFYPVLLPFHLLNILFLTLNSIILAIYAYNIGKLPDVFKETRNKLRNIAYILFIFFLLTLVLIISNLGALYGLLVVVVLLPFSILERVYHYFILKYAYADIAKEKEYISPIIETLVRKPIAMFIAIFVGALLIFALFVTTNLYVSEAKTVAHLKKLLDSTVVLGDKTRFEMKEECAKYKPDIEKEINKDWSTYAPTDTRIENYLTEIFYSPKENSCMYISTELTYRGGDLTFQQPRLVDALSNVVVYAGLTQVGSPTYQSDLLKFDNYVDQYR